MYLSCDLEIARRARQRLLPALVHLLNLGLMACLHDLMRLLAHLVQQLVLLNL